MIKLVSLTKIFLLIVVSGIVKLDVNRYACDKEDASCPHELNSVGSDNA